MKFSLEGFKPSRFTKLSLAAGGVLALAWLLLTLFASEGPKKTAARADPNVCPDCGRPLSKQARATGDCPYCRMEDPQGYDKKKKARDAAARNSSIPVVMVSLFSVLLAVNLAVLVRSRFKRPVADEQHHVHCRKCNRKVRYRASQAGKFARCPHCRDLMRFPQPAAEDGGRWSVVRRWLSPAGKKPHADSA